ncbi:hypothetical protein [Pararhizobium sp. PWRC1-1]|uniref:hypothetical protein n=1 Tax=Pararhizobium sp. PWRC1-1 TaxID=2804566 RepID=UPI003CEA6A33
MPIEQVETRFKPEQDERPRDMLAAENKLKKEGKADLAERMARYRPRSEHQE